MQLSANHNDGISSDGGDVNVHFNISLLIPRGIGTQKSKCMNEAGQGTGKNDTPPPAVLVKSAITRF